MTTFTLEPQYLFKLASMPRGFTSRSPVNNRCNVPFYTIVVDFLGNCLLCDCDGWLPLPVGKVTDFDSIEQVLTSPAAQLLQQDINTGNFSWCAIDNCGIRDKDKVKKRMTLAINIDESCNLCCPSCRRDPVMLSQGPEYEKKLQGIQRIVQWLSDYNDPIHITMSGNGDPMASHVMRPLLLNYKPRSNQTFQLMTNGLLIRKLLPKIPMLDHITELSISVDAGTQAVYEDVRRPGKWHSLLDNLDCLQQMQKTSITHLNFVLQNKNFRDIPAFLDLCQKYGVQGRIQELTDWGTWSIMNASDPDPWTIKNGTFEDHDVLRPSHPNHNEACEIIIRHLDHPSGSFSTAIRQCINWRMQS